MTSSRRKPKIARVVKLATLRHWFAQAGVSVLGSPQLANCVDESTPLGETVCILKLINRSLCLIRVYAPSSSALYPEFVEETSDAHMKG